MSKSNLSDSGPPMCHSVDVIEKYLTLPKKNISLLTFILQGYEGCATATTIDKTRAIVKLFIMADFLQDIEELLKRLGIDIKMEDVLMSPD
jgi:intein/homing endonuclease